MIYDYMPMAYRFAGSLDALLYGTRLQFGVEMESELIWGEFADEVYRRGGGDVGDMPDWMS